MLSLCMGYPCLGFQVTRAVGKERSGLESARAFAGWGDNVSYKGEGLHVWSLSDRDWGRLGLLGTSVFD